MPAAHLVPLFNSYQPILNRHFPPGTPFNSHDFIQKLTQKHQAEYIKALDHYRRKGTRGPFKVLHNRLARLLRSRGLNCTHTGDTIDENIFGEPVKIYTWRRT
jgi:hypothetical protein